MQRGTHEDCNKKKTSSLTIRPFFFFLRIRINLLPVRRHFLKKKKKKQWKIISPETSKNTIISGRRSPSREVHQFPARLPLFSKKKKKKKNVKKIVVFTYIRSVLGPPQNLSRADFYHSSPYISPFLWGWCLNFSSLLYKIVLNLILATFCKIITHKQNYIRKTFFRLEKQNWKAWHLQKKKTEKLLKISKMSK